MFLYSYESAGGLAGNQTTSAAPNTEVDHMTMHNTSGKYGLAEITTGGMSTGLTTISGIAFRLKRFATASTGGQVENLKVLDPGNATQTNFTFSNNIAITLGATPTFIGGWISGATGPGGWSALLNTGRIAMDPDPPGTAVGTGSIDFFSASATASLLFEFKVYVSQV